MIDAGLADVEGEAPSVFQQLDNRIKELRAIAADEGILFSDDSLTRTAEFLGGIIAFSSVPKLFLLESGNFRAAWRNNGEQVLRWSFCRPAAFVMYFSPVVTVRLREQLASIIFSAPQI